ncbi:CDP-alcohol phosphatidyltransferase family protein [Specibacter sp. RAF43]|uniref:CDP-alcohol phosphatidyltransferase family protein n=1 Tax=Specibacter sp. RAF43 TaxID=3233057 RepID=UPI003F987097
MRSVQSGPIVGLSSQLALLPVLALTVGLGAPGWGAGIVYALAANAALARGLARRGAGGFGPADWVTLVRATLVAGVAALVAEAFVRPAPVAVLVTLAALAIVLDAVDGRVARTTGTTSELGARFDMEVDAFLILALAIYVAPRIGVWVLMIGAARYLLLAAGRFLPWLRAAAPPRYWCKVVAVIQGVALTIAAADIVPRPVMGMVLRVALVLLAESFGKEVWWLWRHRRPGGRPKVPALTLPAVLLVWLVLVIPADPSLITPAAFVSIPLGGLVIVTAALVLPPARRRGAARLAGVLLGLLALLKALNLGFFAALDRPFDAVGDWSYLGPGVGVLGDSIGPGWAIVAVAAAAVLAVAVVIVMALAVGRLCRAAAAHRRVSVRTVTALGVVWILCAVTGLQVAAGVPVASTSAAALVYRQLQHDVVDRNAFLAQIARDPVRDVPAEQLLTGLRGKDVLLVFVESYGRIAVQGGTFSPGVAAALRAGTGELAASGFAARSAFLTSPTFGGISWLAHSTLQSGLWVDSQRRYDDLLPRDRLTLTGAFARAGWRTVSDIPADTTDWPEGKRFYHYDAVYDSRNVGYRGPKFSYATMPDQYVLSAFHRLELAPARRAPVMAEIDLVSSHTPWTPLPRPVPWEQVGDGTIFDGMPALGESPKAVYKSPEKIRGLYGQSIEYTLNTLVSFVTSHPDPNLVLIVVGDHQPNALVSGAQAGHDVPVSIIAADPNVLAQISAWNWQAGMLPQAGAPVWPMSAFRDRFLAAYSPALNASPPAGASPAGRPGPR